MITSTGQSTSASPKQTLWHRLGRGLGLAVILAAVALGAIFGVRAADQTPREQFDAVMSRYNAAVGAFQKELAAATNDAERGKAFSHAPDPIECGRQLLQLAKTYADSPVAEDGLVWIFTFVPQSTYSGMPGQSELVPVPVAGEALDLLMEHHLKSSKLGEACRMGGHFQFVRNPRTEEFLHKVADQNTNPPVRAQALLTLAQINQNRAQTILDLREKGPDLAKRLKLTMSADQFERLQKADPAAFSDEAERLYEAVAKEFATVPVPNSSSKLTFGDQARAALLEMRGLAVGQPAPDLESVDLEGADDKLSRFKGKVVVLDVWATWCGPCVQMIPHERELVKRMEGKPFVLVSVSVDADKASLQKFLKKEPMPWVHWWNGAKGGIIDKWNVHGYPTIFVLDAKGTIRFKNTRGAELDEAVDQLVKEATVSN